MCVQPQGGKGSHGGQARRGGPLGKEDEGTRASGMTEGESGAGRPPALGQSGHRPQPARLPGGARTQSVRSLRCVSGVHRASAVRPHRGSPHSEAESSCQQRCLRRSSLRTSGVYCRGCVRVCMCMCACTRTCGCLRMRCVCSVCACMCCYPVKAQLLAEILTHTGLRRCIVVTLWGPHSAGTGSQVHVTSQRECHRGGG